jgi:hypothetical protein
MLDAMVGCVMYWTIGLLLLVEPRPQVAKEILHQRERVHQFDVVVLGQARNELSEFFTYSGGRLN